MYGKDINGIDIKLNDIVQSIKKNTDWNDQLNNDLMTQVVDNEFQIDNDYIYEVIGNTIDNPKLTY
jgi:hypothetical protein